MSLSLKKSSLVVGIPGLTLDRDVEAWLRQEVVGGVILFSRNYESPHQLLALCGQIQDLKSPRLFICVDQEGGRVQRFKNDFFALPALSLLGALYDQNPERAARATRAHAWVMINELISCGLDFSLAPVVDLGGCSKVIGDRAFHADPSVVATLAGIYCRRLLQQGSRAVIKHFPGHGSVEADSHTHHPRDQRPKSDIVDTDLIPFMEVIQARKDQAGRDHANGPDNAVDGVMMSHVVYPAFDSAPAGFSGHWTQRVLRQSLGFAGSIFSDDLGMQAASVAGELQDRVSAAAQGCDYLLVCEPGAAESVVAASTACGNSAATVDFQYSGERASLTQLRKSRQWRENTNILGEMLGPISG